MARRAARLIDRGVRNAAEMIRLWTTDPQQDRRTDYVRQNLHTDLLCIQAMSVYANKNVEYRRSNKNQDNNWYFVWLNGLVVSALGIRTRGPGFDYRVVPLFHWVATLGKFKLFTHIASPVSQLQETGVQKGSFRHLSDYGD